MNDKLVSLINDAPNDIPTMYVLSGIPGSGKTTLGKELATEYGLALHTYDDVPNANRKGFIESARNHYHNNIIADLKNGKSVICDRSYVRVEGRKLTLDAVAGIKCRKVIIVLTTPFDECVSRNNARQRRLPEFVIKELYKKCTEPALSEGWDEIVHI